MTSPGRIIGIVVGAFAILGIGVYGPAMLLGPLPEVAVRLEPAATAATEVPPLTLPADGRQRHRGRRRRRHAARPSRVAGDTAAVPIGGAAKMVTLLVTLDSLPLSAPTAAARRSPSDPRTTPTTCGTRARVRAPLPVSPGDTWSERDVVRAVLLASSNNHADTLVRWAFGGVDAYVEAANAWLAEHGFTATRVADATGLSGDNVGTAEELARLAAMVLADPELAAMLDDPGAAPVGARNVPDLVGRDVDGAARAITRSFTDQAGLSYVFTAELPAAEGVEGGPRRITGAMLLMPDYETLDPAVAAAVGSAAAASAPVTVIAEGTPYARVEAPWGDRADLVASTSRADAAWGSAFGEATVSVDEFSTAPEGREVGRVSVPTADRRDRLAPAARGRDPRSGSGLAADAPRHRSSARSSPVRTTDGANRDDSVVVVLVELHRVGVVGVEAEPHPQLPVDLTLVDGVVPEEGLQPVDGGHHADTRLGLAADEDPVLELPLERAVDEFGDVLCCSRVCVHGTTLSLGLGRAQEPRP